MPEPIKVSSPATAEFWEIPVLYESDTLLALDKPAGLLVSPDAAEPARPSLMALLHQGIERGAPWAKSRALSYLMNSHRLDGGASGVLVLARTKPALVALTAQFATDEPRLVYVALARGHAAEESFAAEAKLAPHPLQMGIIRVDSEEGKRSHTAFTVRERFKDHVLLECRPLPDRMHQIPVHLKYLRLPLVGAASYGGRPLFLSTLKSGYRLKPGQTERPLIAREALHVEKVTVKDAAAGANVTIEAPWPKGLTVSVKYLRRYAAQAVNPIL